MRSPCCDREGPWTKQEDQKLIDYVRANGQASNWRSLPRAAGLQRCGNSCRLRWTNYLRHDDQHSSFSDEEEDLIIRLHKLLGNRWSLIAGRLPGRSDDEVKNHWNVHMRKRLVSVRQAGDAEHSYSTIDNNTSTNEAERDVTFTLPDLNLGLASPSPAKPNETETESGPTLLLFI